MKENGGRRVALLACAVALAAATAAAEERPAKKRPNRPDAPPAVKKEEPPREPAPPQPATPEGFVRDQEFARPGGKGGALKLDLFLPTAGTRPYPVVVWIHGGGWQSGRKDQCPARYLGPKGYAVASISYRLSQQARFPAQIEDCKAAVRWIRANAAFYGLDADRIGAWGSSAGGHLAALLGTTGDVAALEGTGGSPGVSSRVQAVCDWFGPTDFLQMDAHAPADSRIQHDSPASPESKLVGGPIQENKEACAKASPLTYISRDDPPFLIMHGDKDNLVPIHQSEILHAALRRVGLESTFLPVEGAGHGFSGDEHYKKVEEFFDRHLKRSR
jgi:acetyl esterase/lipase